MNYFEEALRTLLANRLRSFLTTIGLVIGVASVVSILVLGQAMSGAITGTLSGLDDRAFVVYPKAGQPGADHAAIKVADLTALKGAVREIADAVPAGGRQEMVHLAHRRYRLVMTPDSERRLSDVPLAQGRAFTADDVRDALSVCIISDKAYRDFFAEGDVAVGSSIYAGPNRYVIVGVQAAPRTAIVNISFGGDIAIPYTAYINRYVPGHVLYAARFLTASGVSVKDAEDAVIAELRRLHRSPAAEYQTFDKQSTSKGIDSVFAVITVVVALLGAVSLLVAGIGIMNILLVSVAERVREIGIRKAIGAKSKEIMVQFLIEALLLSCVGCSIGLALGLGAGWAVNHFAIVAVTGYLAPLPWVQSGGIAVLFAVTVTVVFGTYPAYRAARLDPIVALRHE